MRIKELTKLRPLIRDFSRQSPAHVLSALGLMVLASFSSGIGILLIIPLLGSVGVSLGESAAATSVSDQINAIFVWLGMQPSLGAVLILYMSLIICVAWLNYLNSIVGAKLQRNFVVHLRNDVFGNLLRAEWHYLSTERASDFARMVTGQVQSMGHTIFMVLMLCSRLVLVMVYLCISLWLSAPMTVVAVLCGLGLILILLPLNKRIHGSGRQELRSYADIFHAVFEQLYSLKIIKSFSAEKSYIERLDRVNRSLEDQQVRMTRFHAFSRFVFLCGAAMIFSLLFYIAIQMLSLPVANLILILFIFSRLMPQMSSIQLMCQQLIHEAPTYLDLLEKNEQLSLYQEKLQDPQTGEKGQIPAFEDRLELKNLSYQYPETEKSVFSNLQLRINHNQSLALCGPSGIGKSTLADIIAGLLGPTTGQMLVDGIEIDDKNRLFWRRNVAYVTQEVLLFDDSIRANLNWVTDRDITDDELWQYLDMAAADFVRALPDQLDSIIGDRGLKLSGGERQRLALARALIAQPEILILDEATSALDRENELRIREALKNLKGKMTIILIAHDEETISHVDQQFNITDFASKSAD